MKKYLIIASILLLAAACQKSTTVPNTSNQPVTTSGKVNSISIDPSSVHDGWIMYTDQAVVKVMAKNVNSLEIRYLPLSYGTEKSQEATLGQASSLSSQQYTWELALPKGLSGQSIWAVGRDSDGNETKSQVLGKFTYQQQFSICNDYTNAEDGYYIKCPAGWKANTSNATTTVLVSPKNFDLYQQVVKGEAYGEGYQPDIMIDYYNSVAEYPENVGNNLGAKTLAELVKKDPLMSGAKKIKVAGANAYGVGIAGLGTYYAILIEHNGHLYQIFFGNTPSASALTKEEQYAIDSFKFLPPSAGAGTTK